MQVGVRIFVVQGKTPEFMLKYLIFLMWAMPFNHPVAAQQVAVMLDKMNVLYVGADNPLHLVVSDIQTESLVLTPSQGTIRTDGNGGFLWRLCSLDSVYARLILSDSTSDVPIDTMYFRVKRIPEPEFVFKKYLIGSVIHHDAAGDWIVWLLNFEADFYFQHQDPVKITNHGAQLNPDVLHYMQRMVPGSMVCFTNFRWKCGCDSQLRFSDARLVVKIDK